MFKIETIKVGTFQTNCYLLFHQNQCLIIDPGDEFDKIRKQIGSSKPLAILITHYHFDHVGALRELQELYQIPVYDYHVDDKDIEVGPFQFQIIAMQGHDDSCVTFYFKNEQLMFVGDFIFKGSIGRTDLKTGDDFKMAASLNKLKQLTENIILYPGHGDMTTLNDEKKYNLFLKD